MADGGCLVWMPRKSYSFPGGAPLLITDADAWQSRFLSLGVDWEKGEAESAFYPQNSRWAQNKVRLLLNSLVYPAPSLPSRFLLKAVPQ